MKAVPFGIIPPALMGEIVVDQVEGQVGRVVGNLTTPYLSLIVSFADGSERTIRFERIFPATEEQKVTFEREAMALHQPS